MEFRCNALWFCTVLASGALTPPALAQAAPAQDAAPEVSDRPVRMPTTPASMPFELRDNLVVVETTIDGKTQPAVLDSGAGALIVGERLAQSLALELGRSAGDAAGAGPQAQQLRSVNVSALKIGPIAFAQLPGHAANLEQLSSSAGFPVDLLVGAPAFKHGMVRVDYRRHRVTFGPSGSGGRCAAPIPLTIVHDAPVVEAELRPTPSADPIRLKLLVDLGTRHRAVVIGGPFVRSGAGKALIASGKAQKVGHGVGGSVQGSLAQVAELRLGKKRLSNLEVALTSGAAAFEGGTFDGTLGVPLWQAGAITFDYPAKVLCIEK